MKDKTTAEMLAEYNGLIAKAVSYGFGFKERKVFKDKTEAFRLLMSIQSAIHAKEQERAQQEEVKVVEEKEKEDLQSQEQMLNSPEQEQDPEQDKSGWPDFTTIPNIEQLLDCYNEMVLTAIDFGLTYLSRSNFDSVEEGIEACTALNADIMNTKQKREQLEEKKNVAKAEKKTTGTKARTKVEGKTAAAKKTGNGEAVHGSRGAGTRFALDAHIEWIGRDGKNPYNPNKSRFEPVEIIRQSNGKTVKTYLEKAGDGGGNFLSLAVRQGYAKIA